MQLDPVRARRRWQYASLKERYREQLAERGPVESDPGVGEDLLVELAESAEALRRANTRAPGEE